MTKNVMIPVSQRLDILSFILITALHNTSVDRILFILQPAPTTTVPHKSINSLRNFASKEAGTPPVSL